MAGASKIIMMDLTSKRQTGSLQLGEDIDPIVDMVSFDDLLEIYKVSKTYRVIPPESINPGSIRTEELWLASPVDEVGSSNLVVARIFLQNKDILQGLILKADVDKKSILKDLRSCKEYLLICYKISKRLNERINEIKNLIDSIGITQDNDGRALNPFPQVQDLNAECDTFLVNANKAIRIISGLPQRFFSFDTRDKNFDKLSDRLTKNKELSNTRLNKFVTEEATFVKRIVDLRNFYEHPEQRTTVIENFGMTSDHLFKEPSWYILGEAPTSIKDEMEDIVNFLIYLCEFTFFFSILERVEKIIPFSIEEIDSSMINTEKPVKYRLVYK